MKKILVAFLLISFLSVSAETFNLGSGANINEAIVNAQDGDEIVLAAGVYTGNIDFLGKAITIRGEGEKTVLRTKQSAPIVSFVSGELNTSVLKDLRLTGTKSVEAISITNSSPIISNCFIDRNRSNTVASGIAISGQAETQVAIIRNTVLALNKAQNRSNDPHQINITNASPIIENNTITRGDSNGIFVRGASSPTIVNNIIALNGSKGRGRGICLVGLDEDTTMNINHNLFFRNTKADIFVNGVDFDDVEKAQLEETTFTLENNLHVNPRFKRSKKARNLTLKPNSPAINAGNPDAQYNDKSKSRNDIGYTGGQNSSFSFITLF